MAPLQQLLAELGVGGSLVFGVPLIVIGLAMRGLARRQLDRLLEARRHRRKIADVAEGPVAVVGVAREPGAACFTVEEAGARIFVEPVEDTMPKAGEPVLVFGRATSTGAGTAGYRSDPRRWTIDPRGDDGLVLVGTGGLGERVARMRLQAIAGALVFATGLSLVVAAAAISFL